MQKTETKKEENIHEEEFRNGFFECFLDAKLKRKNVKKIKKTLSKVGTGAVMAAKILEHNSNIKTLHSCLHNNMGLLFYLLLEEGYNLTDMGKKISPCVKECACARTSVQYWADKYYKELKIILRDHLAKGRGTYYQKDEAYSYLHNLIEEAAKTILTEKKKKELKDSLPEEIINKW